MKSSFYFDHDYNSRNDLKILELRSEFGWDGYGLFWALIETFCEQGGYIKREALGGLSLGLSTDKATLCKLIDFCLKIELLSECEDGIFNKRSLEHLMFRKSLSDYGKKGGRGNKKGEDKSPPLAPPKAVKESKGKDSKAEESKEEKEKEFRKQVFSFKDQYSDKMLLAFFNYWSEKSKSGKMRWEMEKTYELSKRLANWKSREKEEPETKPYKMTDFYPSN